MIKFKFISLGSYFSYFFPLSFCTFCSCLWGKSCPIPIDKTPASLGDPVGWSVHPLHFHAWPCHSSPQSMECAHHPIFPMRSRAIWGKGSHGPSLYPFHPPQPDLQWTHGECRLDEGWKYNSVCFRWNAWLSSYASYTVDRTWNKHMNKP